MRRKIDYVWYGLVIAVFAMAIGCALFFTTKNPQYDMILGKLPLLLEAFWNTIWISFVSLFGALVLGFVLYVMMESTITPIRAISQVFNEIIMGTPLLVMIFLVVYVVSPLVGGTKIAMGVWALILYNSPYIANAYQSTAAVVDKNQYTVMALYHFKWYQKYLYVILPQMIRPFIPSLINNLSSVIKSSALLNVVAVTEITYVTTVVASRNFAFIEGYYVMWLMYLIVTIPLSLLAKYLGKKVAA